MSQPGISLNPVIGDLRGSMVCPDCTGVLHWNDTSVSCTDCGQQWPITDGVFCLVESPCHSADLPEADLRELNRLTNLESWKTALRDCPRPLVREMAAEAQNLERANWRWFLQLDRNSRVLEVSAGLGTVSHALALRCGSVVAAEPNLEQARFIQARFAQEHLSNVEVLRTSVWSLPFAERTFDLIVMDGSLPRVADGVSGSPRQLQQRALDKLYGLLKVGGSLYLGVHNRFDIRCLTGLPDPYTGLPFAAVLPRVIADGYTRWRGRGAYTQYLYGSRGYKRLLRKSGFTQIDMYAAVPGFREPRFLMPMGTQLFRYYLRNFTSGHTTGLRKLLQAALLRPGLLEHFASSFVILAHK